MPETVLLTLVPLGKTMEVPRDVPLRDVLFECGVEFPCGGRGECRGCRIRVLEGNLPTDSIQEGRLTPSEIQAGWRLSCQCLASEDLKIELGRWNADILADHSSFEFAPRTGYGIAIDLGTTTVVAQLLDLTSGLVLGTRSALNSQARHGADVMSRIGFASNQEGLQILCDSIRSQIGRLLGELLEEFLEARNGTNPEIVEVSIVGNTAMSHLFSGIDISPLAACPFEPTAEIPSGNRSSDLGWNLPGNPSVQFLPWLGGFVGSDILAGILATRLNHSEEPRALVDLGTNGEIALSYRGRLMCTSTAAGPAFEGATIKHGMRAVSGAIYRVEPSGEGFTCQVVGGGEPRGLCGSGLVSAIAAGLRTGAILPSGRLANKADEIPIGGPVVLSQTDIRQVQLAKGAIAAGLRMLESQMGIEPGGTHRIYLAGAFGNTIDKESAQCIGLLKFPIERIHSVGNSALLGAKMALFDSAEIQREIENIRAVSSCVSLSSDPNFQDIYAEEMGFPPPLLGESE